MNARKIFIGILLASMPLVSMAQDAATDTTYWTHKGTYTFALSQVSLSNWAGGGEGSISGNTEVSLVANYARDKVKWDNSFRVGYGLIREGDRENLFKKNNDILILTSKYSQALNKKTNITASLDFRSQLAPGLNYQFVDSLDREVGTLISEFLAPGYLLGGVGMSYQPNDWLSMNLAPISGKFTFVLNDSLSSAGLYGVEPGQAVRSEFGYSANFTVNKAITEDVDFKANVLLFSNYQGLNELDINAEAFLVMRINTWLTTNISSQLIWDRDIELERNDGTVGPAVQLRNVINVGLSLNFWQ